MSADPFVHLHVASGYSLQYGASHPQALVQRAVEHGMGALALTDRDGLYGAVKFVLAAQQAGIAPVLGVDLGHRVHRVCDLVRDMGVRVAARGSGAGSLVNHLLGISGVEPIEHGLLMERFCSPLRAQLPDIDLDVESARRTEVYQRVLERFGGERVTCVSMMDTYRVRHAVRDPGAARGARRRGGARAAAVRGRRVAKAFPHIRARDARAAITDRRPLRDRAHPAHQVSTGPRGRGVANACPQESMSHCHTVSDCVESYVCSMTSRRLMPRCCACGCCCSPHRYTPTHPSPS